MAKVKKTFRIEEDAYDELVKLSAGWGVAQGAAVERAIRLARQMPDTCQTDASTPGGGDSAAVAALIEQLAKKDEQIAKLMETVADSTKAVQGAQALHHSPLPLMNDSFRRTISIENVAPDSVLYAFQ